jgi:energy-coupling factor transporter transmembrane protein EcfT
MRKTKQKYKKIGNLKTKNKKLFLKFLFFIIIFIFFFIFLLNYFFEVHIFFFSDYYPQVYKNFLSFDKSTYENLPYAKEAVIENLDTFKKSCSKMNLDYLEHQKKLKGLTELDLSKYNVVIYSVCVGSLLVGFYVIIKVAEG